MGRKYTRPGKKKRQAEHGNHHALGCIAQRGQALEATLSLSLEQGCLPNEYCTCRHAGIWMGS
jgi:hypothetical protein